MLDLNTITQGDCLDVLKTMPDNSVDAIVTDPPYGLGKEPDALAMLTDWMQGRDYVPKGTKGFMGAEWDAFVPQPAIWRECLRVLKPGGHIVAFAGTRTQHLMALGLQIAGFELRDMLAWIYGSGFPKSLNISKAIDKAAGAERGRYARPAFGGTFSDDGGTTYGTAIDNTPITDAAKQWNGFGTSLKPSLEPITLARKPLCGTVAANVQLHGTGGLNIDGCRIGTNGEQPKGSGVASGWCLSGSSGNGGNETPAAGRWPANLLHDGSPEVLAGFPNTGASKAGGKSGSNANPMSWEEANPSRERAGHTDNGGSAARYFYCAKASKRDRDEGLEGFEAKQAVGGGGGIGNYLEDANAASGKYGSEKAPGKNIHPTVKPTAVMQWLCRLITPPGGVVLDPFAGSGSTLKAAVLEGFQFIGIEREAEYVDIARARVAAVQRTTPPLTLF